MYFKKHGVLIISIFNFWKKKERNEINEIDSNLNVIDEQFRKMERKFTELQLCVEELNENITLEKDDMKDYKEAHEKDIGLLIEALVSSADMLEDFYVFSQGIDNEAFKQQASMMWQTIQKKCSTAGLVRLPNENTKTDARYDATVGAEENNFIPGGNIIKNLRSGYLYKNKVIRKGEVIVSKGNAK